jgi:hypothetical protein
VHPKNPLPSRARPEVSRAPREADRDVTRGYRHPRQHETDDITDTGGKAIDRPEQLRLFDPDAEPTSAPSDRPFSSWSDRDLQDFLLLDLDKNHEDTDLKKELDARFSKAFLDVFSNLQGPGPNGITLKLSPGLQASLHRSAEHLDT